jgi:hypothetical protein
VQEPTHILAGVIIQKSLSGVRPRALRLGGIALFAFLSHGLLDRLANFTYHPPQANFHSAFWICFHSGVLVCTILFLVIWWRQYWWGILFACLPDLDWVFIHGQEVLHLRLPFYHQPYMHRLLGLVFDKSPLFSWMRIPSHRLNPWACLWEIALIAGMLFIVCRENKSRPPAPIRTCDQT